MTTQYIKSKEEEIDNITTTVLNYIEIESVKEYRILKKVSTKLVTQKNKEIFLGKEIFTETKYLKEVIERGEKYTPDLKEAIESNEKHRQEQQDFIQKLKVEQIGAQLESKNLLKQKEDIDIKINIRNKLRSKYLIEIESRKRSIQQLTLRKK